MSRLNHKLRAREDDLEGQREDFVREKDALLKDAELNQLRSVEVERRK